MLMADDCGDSMFDLNCGLIDKRAPWALSEDDFAFHTPAPTRASTPPIKIPTDPFDPFLGRRTIDAAALKLSVDRQASLEDLAHVIRSEAALDVPSLSDGADTIQDLAKYLKDDTQNSPTISNLIANASFPYPPNTAPPTVLASVHNYASKAPIQQSPPVSGKNEVSMVKSNYPCLLNIKQERPDTPTSDISIGSGKAGSESSHFDVYTPSPYPRRKRPIIYKEEMDDDDDYYQHEQERDADLPPPRKYVRKNPKSLKDLEEYRKRRERNNEAVRRARAKKRQNEALIHNENRALRAENQRLKTELEATRLKMETQERMLAQLRGPGSGTQPPPRIKKTPRRLSP